MAAFVLGYFVTRLQERLPLSSYRRPLLGTGLCGGLSTFSTMQVEILAMLDAHAWGLAASYTAASVAAGFAAIYLATVLVRRVRVRVHDGPAVGRGRADRRAGSVPASWPTAWSGRRRPGLPVRHVRHQRVRRDDPGPAHRAGPGPHPALLAGTAAVGSYTTFSTWMFETERLTEERQHGKAVVNVAASLVAGVSAAALGRYWRLGTHL